MLNASNTSNNVEARENVKGNEEHEGQETRGTFVWIVEGNKELEEGGTREGRSNKEPLATRNNDNVQGNEGTGNFEGNNQLGTEHCETYVDYYVIAGRDETSGGRHSSGTTF